MKVKKRLFAGMLALAMLLSLNVTVFASEPSDGSTVSVSKEPVESVTLTKTYKLANEGTESPDVKFSYVIENAGMEDEAEGVTVQPSISGDYSVSFTGSEVTPAGASKSFTINLPEIGFTGIGIYSYTIHEVDGNIAGVKYDDKDVTMKITVVNDEVNGGFDYYVALYKDGIKIEDEDAFTNTYEANTLTIKKDVQGNFSDPDKRFPFEIALTGVDGDKYESSYNITGVKDESSSTTVSVGGGTANVNISENDGAIVITNLPYGVTYTVTETDPDDYKVVGENTHTGTIGEVASEVTIVNEKGNTSIDTGVYLDNLPYIIVFAGVLAAVAVLVIRRRRVDD